MPEREFWYNLGTDENPIVVETYEDRWLIRGGENDVADGQTTWDTEREIMIKPGDVNPETGAPTSARSWIPVEYTPFFDTGIRYSRPGSLAVTTYYLRLDPKNNLYIS